LSYEGFWDVNDINYCGTWKLYYAVYFKIQLRLGSSWLQVMQKPHAASWSCYKLEETGFSSFPFIVLAYWCDDAVTWGMLACRAPSLLRQSHLHSLRVRRIPTIWHYHIC